MTFQSKPIMGAKPSSEGDFAGVEIELCFKDNLDNRILRLGTQKIPLGKRLEFSTEWIADDIDDRIDPSVLGNLAFSPIKPDPENPTEEGSILIRHNGEPHRLWSFHKQTANGEPDETYEFKVNQEGDGKLIIEFQSFLYRSEI